MAALPNSANADLSRGFTVAQVAQKHGWPDPMVWSMALEGKNDQDRFKALGWGLRTWERRLPGIDPENRCRLKVPLAICTFLG